MYIAIFFFCGLMGYVGICFYVLYTNENDELELEENIKYRGNLYKNINLRNHKDSYKKLFYIVFLLERFFFVLIPLIFETPVAQLTWLLVLKLCIISLHVCIRPWDLSINLVSLKTLAEVIHHLCFILMAGFTPIIDDEMFKYKIGQFFIGGIAVTFLLHLSIIIIFNLGQTKKC